MNAGICGFRTIHSWGRDRMTHVMLMEHHGHHQHQGVLLHTPSGCGGGTVLSSSISAATHNRVRVGVTPGSGTCAPDTL